MDLLNLNQSPILNPKIEIKSVLIDYNHHSDDSNPSKLTLFQFFILKW